MVARAAIHATCWSTSRTVSLTVRLLVGTRSHPGPPGTVHGWSLPGERLQVECHSGDPTRSDGRGVADPAYVRSSSGRSAGEDGRLPRLPERQGCREEAGGSKVEQCGGQIPATAAPGRVGEGITNRDERSLFEKARQIGVKEGAQPCGDGTRLTGTDRRVIALAHRHDFHCRDRKSVV